MGDERSEAIVVGFQADAHDAAFFRPHIDAGFASRSPAFCLVHVCRVVSVDYRTDACGELDH